MKQILYLRFWLLLSVIYALLCIGCDFIDTPLGGWQGILTIVGHWSIVAIFASALWLAISVNRYIFLGASPIVLTLTAIALYYKYALSVYITPLTIELAMVNNLTVWATAIDWQLIVSAIIAILAGVAVAIYRFRHVATPKHSLLWLITGAVIASIPLGYLPSSLIQRLKAPVSARVPFNTIYNYIFYLQDRHQPTDIRPAFDHTPASCPTDSLTVVVILGESLRADHMSLNGYHRNTTPLLSATPNVVSLPNMHSPYTYTYLSVPYILTRADSLNSELSDTEPGFMTLFSKAGYSTAWIGNQDDARPYAYFMQNCDTMINNGNTKSIYTYDKWLDTELLPHVDNILAHAAPRLLLMLHTIGSHWWYRSHYAQQDAHFKPEIDSRVFNDLSNQQIINSYDNTIIASDRFWHEIISRLGKRRAVVLYVSDHGELLGEHGMHMHYDGYEECMRPAAFIWMSDRYLADFPEKAKALQRKATLPHDLDVIFHTALSLGNIATPVRIPSKSLVD